MVAGVISNGSGVPSDPSVHKIEFDMMLKGNTYQRPSGVVRQCAVTVDGSTQLVTSGDIVNQKVYDALIDFKAIMPSLLSEIESKPKTK